MSLTQKSGQKKGYAKVSFPNRFKGKVPVPKSPPVAAWINKPATEELESDLLQSVSHFIDTFRGKIHKMKIALIRPPTVTYISSPLQEAVPPIGLAYLASSLKHAGHEIVGIDAIGEGLEQWGVVDDWPEVRRHGISASELIKRIPTDSQLIAVSCMFSATWPYVKNVLQAIRQTFPDVPIVVGGEHVTAVPEYVLDTCSSVDYCIKGEGERAIVILCEALEGKKNPEEIRKSVLGVVLRIGGRIVHGAEPKRIKEIDSISEPDWDSFPIRNFLDGGYQYGVDRGRSMPILASRGCPY